MRCSVINQQNDMAVLESHVIVEGLEIFIPETADHPGFAVVAIYNRKVPNVDPVPLKRMWCLVFVDQEQAPHITARGVGSHQYGNPCLLLL